MENKNLIKALAAFQQECPSINKNTKGYGYKYADLPAILEVINPLLKKHGLGFTQLLENTLKTNVLTNPELSVPVLKTIIFHIESGESIESVVVIENEQIQKNE